MHVLGSEKAAEKDFDEFVIGKQLHGVDGEFVESRKDCAELELQKSFVGAVISIRLVVKSAKTARKW